MWLLPASAGLTRGEPPIKKRKAHRVPPPCRKSRSRGCSPKHSHHHLLRPQRSSATFCQATPERCRAPQFWRTDAGFGGQRPHIVLDLCSFRRAHERFTPEDSASGNRKCPIGQRRTRDAPVVP